MYNNTKQNSGVLKLERRSSWKQEEKKIVNVENFRGKTLVQHVYSHLSPLFFSAVRLPYVMTLMRPPTYSSSKCGLSYGTSDDFCLPEFSCIPPGFKDHGKIVHCESASI